MTMDPEQPNPTRPAQPPAAAPARRSRGTKRIVFGIIVLVLAVLGTLGSLSSAQPTSDGGGAAEMLGTVIGRLLFIALGVALVVSGSRARRRAQEPPQI